MPLYRITIEEAFPVDGKPATFDYGGAKSEIYMQTTNSEIDLMAVIRAFNGYPTGPAMTTSDASGWIRKDDPADLEKPKKRSPTP